MAAVEAAQRVKKRTLELAKHYSDVPFLDFWRWEERIIRFATVQVFPFAPPQKAKAAAIWRELKERKELSFEENRRSYVLNYSLRIRKQ